MTLLLTTASREDRHFRIGNTGTDKKETRFVLHMTRAPAFSDKDNKTGPKEEVFSRTALAVLPKKECVLFEQHQMIWAVCCQQLNVLFSLKCLLGRRVFRVLRCDQQASLTASFPSLSEEHCCCSSWAFRAWSQLPRWATTEATRPWAWGCPRSLAVEPSRQGSPRQTSCIGAQGIGLQDLSLAKDRIRLLQT